MPNSPAFDVNAEAFLVSDDEKNVQIAVPDR